MLPVDFNPPQLHQPRSHHREIGQHVVLTEELSEGLHNLRDLPTCLHDFLIVQSCPLVPVPGIFKRFDLGSGTNPTLLSEEDVVILVRFEGRVKVDQVYGFILDITSQNFEVIPVVKSVLNSRQEPSRLKVLRSIHGMVKQMNQRPTGNLPPADSPASAGRGPFLFPRFCQ